MNQLSRIILIVLLLVAAVLVWVELNQPEPEPAPDVEVEEPADTTHTSLKGVELIVTSPTRSSVVASPLTITGEAPGTWYFEATFPVTLVNWDGLIIAEGLRQLKGNG